MLAALSGWREELSVTNGGGWTEASVKIPGQFGDAEGTKWSGTHTAGHYRAAKHQSWTQERQGKATVVSNLHHGRHSVENVVVEVDHDEYQVAVIMQIFPLWAHSSSSSSCHAAAQYQSLVL